MAVEPQGGGQAENPLRAYLEYFRDLGVHDFYRNGEPQSPAPEVAATLASTLESEPVVAERPIHPAAAEPLPAPVTPRITPSPPALVQPVPTSNLPGSLIPKPVPFNSLAPLPELRLAPAQRAPGLEAIRATIGDCTRCPLAYAGRRNIVFGTGDAAARLMFVGEGPGADEDETGQPFVGKSGQLLTNMIGAMGLTREQVYIANIVKCRPPANRAPEPVEANTCTQFLVRQIDTVQPEFIVALGLTAAAYLLGTKQSLTSLRGQWHDVRGSRAIVTFHPAYLLRDPRQKGEAWKDLQTVMHAMGLKGAAKS